MAQRQWASVDYRKNVSLVGLIQYRGHKEIVAIGSYADDTDGRAEVAFVVREDFQGMGIASLMLRQLEMIARVNDFKGFIASVLCENAAMLHVFKKCYPELQANQCSAGEMTLVMDFGDASRTVKSS